MLGHLYNNSYTRCISSLALTSKLLAPITNFYYSFIPLSAGFIIGLILSGIVMGLLSSAVDSIIVCFAEAPIEFAESHPSLAQEMQTAWSAAWPEEFRGVAIISLGGGLGIV